MAEYFELNTGTTGDALIEWEAFKVSIRGKCLGINWNIRRQLEEAEAREEAELMQLEIDWASKSTGIAALEVKRGELTGLLERLRQFNYVAHSARAHAQLDKAGRLLAWLI